MLSLFRRKRREPAAWRRAPVFRHLGDEEAKLLEGMLATRTLEPGERLVEQGKPVRALFVLVRGSLDVLKREAEREREHRIDTITTPGEVIGEASLLETMPAAASVSASTESEVRVVPFERLRQRAVKEGKLAARAHQQLVAGLADVLALRLRVRGDEALEDARQREAMGEFIVNVLILMCLYVFVLGGLPHIGAHMPASTSYVSIPLQLVFGVGSWLFIRGTGYPLERFGIGWRHLFGSLIESLLFTVPILALLTGIKQVLLWIEGTAGSVPLIAHPDPVARLADPSVWPLFAIYAVSSAVQELIVRGALQSSLTMFLTGARRVARAVAVSALLFSVTHLHMSFLFAALAFVPGLFWGWLYARRPNLLGPVLSHIAVGAYVFFIMGVGLR